MLYPYKDKFMDYDTIRDCLTGYGRMIFYRAIDKDALGRPDPTVVSTRKNWIMFIKEGEFYKGMAEGFQRQLYGYNGFCKLGYFYENEPYGKFVEYDIDGNEVQKMGVYAKEDYCVKELIFDSFEENLTPDKIILKKKN